MTSNDSIDAIAKARRHWEGETLAKALERHSERRESFETVSGLPTDRLYTPEQIRDLDYERDLGFPGEFPFTRGIQPTMYRGRPWTIRQYAGFGTSEETNKRFKFLLSQGQPGLSVAFDLPTQMGLDSDDPRAEGEVGQVGVAIDSLADLEICFDGISLDKVSTSMTINAPAPVLVAMYIAAGENQGVDRDKLSGTAQNDVLKEYDARGTYIYPPKQSLRLAADLISWCAEYVPRFNAISLSGYHVREAGSTAVQEIAFSFSNAIAYIEAVQERGMDIDDFAPRISWIFNTHMNFFEEIAKYRALRRLWAKIMKERFGATNPKSMMVRTHTQTGGSTLTAQQPENNITRAAIQALAATLGGVQSMALSCFDEAFAIPTEKAQTIAVRTQQIIADEIGVTDTVDPVGGSYYVEWLTDELERRAVEEMKKIEKLGGAVEAVESGYYNEAILDEACRWEKQVTDGERVVVGVNKYRDENDPQAEYFKVDPSLAEAQKQKLEKLRDERDNAAVDAVLAKLRKTVEGNENVMPVMLEAIHAYATLGEVCGTMKEVFGEFSSPAKV